MNTSDFYREQAFAREHGVSVAELRLDVAFAEAVDKLSTLGSGVKDLILSGKSGFSKLQIILKAEMMGVGLKGGQP